MRDPFARELDRITDACLRTVDEHIDAMKALNRRMAWIIASVNIAAALVWVAALVRGQ